MGQLSGSAAVAVEQTASGYRIGGKPTAETWFGVEHRQQRRLLSDNVGVVSSAKVGSAESPASSGTSTASVGSRPRCVIEQAGSISLDRVGENYVISTIGWMSGARLRMSSAAVKRGEFGWWMPIGAEQMAGGYQVVWEIEWRRSVFRYGSPTAAATPLQFPRRRVGEELGGEPRSASLRPGSQQRRHDRGVDRGDRAGGSTRLVRSPTLLWPSGRRFVRPSGEHRRQPRSSAPVRINAARRQRGGGGCGLVWRVRARPIHGLDPRRLPVAYLGEYGRDVGRQLDLPRGGARLQRDLNNDGTIGTSRFDIAVAYTGDPAYQSYFAGSGPALGAGHHRRPAQRLPFRSIAPSTICGSTRADLHRWRQPRAGPAPVRTRSAAAPPALPRHHAVRFGRHRLRW